MNLDLRHTRADLLRAAMEGIALGLRNVLDELRKLAPVAEPLTLVGGGANSPLWRQIYANVYDMPVVRTRAGQQAAALGAAAVAGVGVGIWKDFGIIDEISTVTERNEPEVDAAAAYERLMVRYKQTSALLGVWAKN
jgi:xylulokinase